MAETLFMSYMDVWSGLRWISASTMRLWHIFYSTSDPESSNLWPTWPVYWYKGAPICPWDSISMAQAFFICLIWMYEVVWGGYQPQPWRYRIILIPQVTLISQSLGQLCWCNNVGVYPHALETAYQLLKQFIWLTWMYEVVWGGYQPQPRQSDIIFTPQVNLNRKILGQLGRCNGIRVHPYALRQHTNGSNIFICPIWMCEVVWGWYQPQPSGYGIVSPHKWTWLHKPEANLAGVTV